MVEFVIGVGVGMIASIALAALILAFLNRAPDDGISQHRHVQARDYDRESRIAAARLRNIREKDIPEAR